MAGARVRRLLATLVFLAVSAGLARAAEPPRLVVFVAIDGLPQRQLLAVRPHLAPDGLARFLDRGAWFAQAHYGHAYTLTAPGHAAMLTGAYPHRTGIVANEWLDPATGAPSYNTADPRHRYIGHATHPLNGTSPRNLLAETVGDVLRRTDPRAKVIAISGKDRGAILPAGRLGTAYMYMAQTGSFASSSYYMPRHPDWVDAFHAARPADRWFRSEWKPLLPDAAYAGAVPDDPPWFGRRGGRLPMRMASPDDETPGPAYYGALLRSPFADQLALEFALAAVRGEGLGRDAVPDLLVVSLSGHDYVNHAYSAESRLSQDHLLQVDRLLQAFFHEIDALVGRGRWLAALTSDHGFMPAPEVLRAQSVEAGRLQPGHMVARVNAELERRFGAALVVGSPGSGLLVDRPAAAALGLDPHRVAEAARQALLREPGIAAAYTRRELETDALPQAPHFAALRRSWHPERSADVQYVVQPGWMLGSAVATHGSPHPYDTHVPILLWGPGWVKPGRVDARVEVVDIAPTLAVLLGLPPPAASEGRALPLP